MFIQQPRESEGQTAGHSMITTTAKRLRVMEQDPIHATPSAAAGAGAAALPALAVLSDPSLLAHITQFQRGIPLLIHELADVFQARHPSLTVRGGLYWASALKFGDLAAVQLLCRMRQWPELANDRMMKLPQDLPSEAATFQRLDVLQWLHATDIEPAPWRGTILRTVTSREHDEIARWLMANRPDACAKNAPDYLANAAASGNLSLLLELIAFRPDALVDDVMDSALRNGHWDVIHYLHEHSPAGCSVNGMDRAADESRLNVVKFLHEHRTEGCTTKAMDSAARHGDMELLTFLHEHRTEGCTTRAMDGAAWNGHLDIVVFLHKNRKEGCTVGAMNRAAARGHLDVVQFLHEHRTEGCTEKAMVDATENGHLEVVKYLHEKCGVVVRVWRMAELLEKGNLAMVKYVHEVIGLPFEDYNLRIASRLGNNELVEYVRSHMPTVVGQ